MQETTHLLINKSKENLSIDNAVKVNPSEEKLSFNNSTKDNASKGDGSVMSDVEDELKNAGGMAKVSPTLALARSLRRNIESTTRQIEKRAYILIILDWLLFVACAICMGLISLGINGAITPGFDLNQLLGVISISLKTAEKSLNLPILAKDKQYQVKELKKLTLQISSIEFILYNNPKSINTEEAKNKIHSDVKEMWERFNNIEIKTFLPPPRPEVPEKPAA